MDNQNQKEPKNSPVLAGVSIALMLFDILGVLIMPNVGTKIAYLLATIIISPFMGKFVREKNIIKGNQGSVFLAQFLLSVVAVIFFSFALSGLNKKEPEIPEISSKTTEEVKQELLLYDENGIKVTYKGMDTSSDKIKLNLLIENNTDEAIGVQTRDLSINDYMIDNIFSSGVASKKRINDDIDIYISELEKNEISPDKIETAEFKFRFFNPNDFSDISYSKYIKLDFVTNTVSFEESENNDTETVLESPTSPEPTTGAETIPETTEPPTEAVAEPETEEITEAPETKLETEPETEKKEIVVDYSFVSNHQNEIVVAAKMALDNFISGYEMSLAPQLWTIAVFDDSGAVMATTDMTYNGINGEYIYVGTLNLTENGKVESATPHYVYAMGTVLGDDGYCDDFFEIINGIVN